VNSRLTKFIIDEKKLHNEWVVLDYPSPDVIRSIYQSNDYNVSEFNKNKAEAKGWLSSVWTDAKYYISKSLLNMWPFGKRDENNMDNVKACLQRKLIIDEQGNQQDLVKTDYKCVQNKLNQWSFKPNGDYYSIISAYDGKCLNIGNNGLYMQECRKNNIYEHFSIKDGKICSRYDISKCLDGNYGFHQKILESKKYDNLKCSTRFAKYGYTCCSNQNTQVQYVDEIGNWGVENGKLCGIGYERCSFSALADPYPCCSSVNPEVVQTDENGNTWGLEDGQWCGIGEATFNSKVRIRNLKKNKCLVTYPSNNNSNSDILDRLALGECNTEYSSWSIIENKIISDYTKNCLYVKNGIDTAMGFCDKVINGDDNYLHFDLIDDKYICVKYNLDSQKCFNGENLRFITSIDDYSKWAIERPNNRLIKSIDEFITKNPEFKPERKIITVPPSTSTLEPTSECYSKAGYPCCSPENTEVIYTDEEGNWSFENGGWCLMSGSTITTTTSTPEPTSTPTNSEPSVTIKPGHNVYWFYHAFTNKCLYAPQKPNKPITIKACDDSDYSKWMVLTSRKGYFYSMAHPDYCLRVSDVDSGSLELGKCDEQAKMVHDNDGFFGLIESNDKCVGLLNENDMYNDEIEMNLNTCTKGDAEKFFNWDHNPTPNTVCFSEVLGYPCCSDSDAVVVTTDEYGEWSIENNHWCGILGSENTVAKLTPLPNTETYYLYNSYSDKCIHSSGILESPITLDKCDYTTYSLWDIP